MPAEVGDMEGGLEERWAGEREGGGRERERFLVGDHLRSAFPPPVPPDVGA